MSVPVRKRAVLADVEDDRRQNAPLRQCVREALDAYLSTLEGEDPGELFRLVMGEVEVPMLEAVLAHTRGNQSRAAKMLGISRGTLRNKLKQYGLE